MRARIQRILTWTMVILGMYIAVHQVVDAAEHSNIKLAVSGVILAFFSGMLVVLDSIFKVALSKELLVLGLAASVASIILSIISATR